MKEQKAMAEINKGLNTAIKQRGVKVGAKRGSYKKSKTNDVDSISNSEVNTAKENGTDNGSESTTTENVSQTSNTTSNSADDKYKKFIAEYGTPKPDNINFSEPEKTEEKIDNKSYDFTKKTNEQPSQQQIESDMQDIKKKSAILVNGYMLLALCDFVFPLLLVKLWGLFDERAKEIKSKRIKLDKDQKDSLKESADIVAMWIFEKIHPGLIFGIGMMVMYGSNLSNHLEEIPKRKKVIKEENEENVQRNNKKFIPDK